MVVVLDTNIIIDLTHGGKNLADSLNSILDEIPAITIVNKCEFLRGIIISNMEGEREKRNKCPSSSSLLFMVLLIKQYLIVQKYMPS